jgi:small subunit ribosomal protein S1
METSLLEQDLAPPELEEILEGKEYAYRYPRRGDIRKGVILSIGPEEIVVNIGLKREGIVPSSDLERLGEEAVSELEVGNEVPVFILKPRDQSGNMIVSLHRARLEQDWLNAQELLVSKEVWEGIASGYNRGGLVVPFGKVRGFVPASQITSFPRRLHPDQRESKLAEMVGRKLHLRVIEVDRRRRRLVFSERAGERKWREQQRERLMQELCEGDIVRGTVSNLCDFGAFVDVGGADGLVHVSELSWQRVRHPREVLHVGEKVDVYILRLDYKKKRIGLSIKRLQPEPWTLIDDKYDVGQLLEGTITKVTDFGAFALIKEGVEGLIHISELAEPAPNHPDEILREGDQLLLRIVKLDVRRRRLGLSLKRVLQSEWDEWAAQFEEPEEPQLEETEPAEVAEWEELQPVEDEQPEVGGPEAPFDTLRNSGRSAEPVAAVSGDEIEIVEEDQGVESNGSEEVEVVTNDAGFWTSFVEEEKGDSPDGMERLRPFGVEFEGLQPGETR